MKQRIVAAVLLFGVVAEACQNSAPPTHLLGPPSGDIVIASDLPLTAGDENVAAERAIRLAISEQQHVGRFKLAYWSLNDAPAGSYLPEIGIENVSWMLDVPRVLGMIGPFPSGVAQATIPVANNGGLVMISPSNTNLCLTRLAPPCHNDAATFRPSGRINYFRIAPPDPTQGLAMARYVATHLGIRRVAVINEWHAGGTGIIDSFTRELQRVGGEVVLREDVDPGTSDFQKFVASARSANAQAIYAVGDTDGLICAARAQMPDDMLFLGVDGVAGFKACVDQAANKATSILATIPDVDITGSSDPDGVKEVTAFKRAYPGAPILEYTFAAYDCTRLLIAAIEQAVNDAGGLPNRSQVLTAVARITYKGLTGTYSFDANGDAISPMMEIFDVENGAWVNKGKIDATAAPA